MLLRTLAVVVLLPGTVLAQQTAAPAVPTQTGSVSGHVYFAGTNAPARFATVALQSLDVKSEDRPFKERQADPPIRVYQTQLDGSFQIPRVPPGTYYVVVKYPGALSPYSQFSNKDLAHPSPEVQQRIAESLPMVTVAPNNTATIDVRLMRGASLAGTVLFDDGTPYAGGSVSLMQRGPDGKWMEARLAESVTTDDQGHFRMTGLPGGEYTYRVSLTVTETLTNAVLSGPTSWWSNYEYGLDYYNGDTARMSEAKPFKLDDSEELSGQLLTIPISKLHTVSGSIVEQRTGRAINQGMVTLLYADDHSEAAKAAVVPTEVGFRMSFVPEGEYLIQVTSASDVRHEDIPNPFGTMPPTHARNTTLRTYTGTEPQPLIVHGDMQGLNLPVVATPAAGKTPTPHED